MGRFRRSYRLVGARRRYRRSSVSTTIRRRGFFGLGSAAQEGHFFDTFNGVLGTPTVAVVGGPADIVDFIPLGSGISQRLGKTWFGKGLQFKGFAMAPLSTYPPAAGNQFPVVGRLAFVWDYQPNGAFANVSDVWMDNEVDSEPRRDNASRFKIFYSRRFLFTSLQTATGNQAGAVQLINSYFRIPQLLSSTTSAGTTGAIGERITGALLIFWNSNQTVDTASPQLVLQMRYTYSDPAPAY